MAQQFFFGENPFCRTIGDATLSPGSLHQVIGLVDDVREGGLDDSLRPALYFPANQNPGHYLFLVVRTAQDPASAMPALSAAIHRLDPNPVSAMSSP